MYEDPFFSNFIFHSQVLSYKATETRNGSSEMETRARARISHISLKLLRSR